MTRDRIATYLLVLLAVLMSTHTAAAQPAAKTTEAKELYIAGAKAYRQGNFDQALVSLRRSYQLAPRPKTLVNIAAVLIDKGETAAAANVLHEALTGSTKLDAASPATDRARSILATLDKQLGRLSYRVEVEAQLSVAAWSVSTPGSGIRRFTPGAHEIVLRGLRGQVLSRHFFSAAPNEVEVFEFKRPSLPALHTAHVGDTLPKIPALNRERHDQQRSIVRSPTLWLGLSSLVLGAGGLAFGAAAWNKLDQAESLLSDPRINHQTQVRQLESEARDRARFANVSFAAAGVAAVGAVILYVLRGRGSSLSVRNDNLVATLRF